MMDNIREKLVELLKKTEINKINGHTALAEVCFTPNVFENMATNLIANGVTVVQQPRTNEDAIRAVNDEALVAFITRQWVLCVDVCECCEYSVWDIVEGRHCALGGGCPPVVWEKALKRWMQKPFKMSPRWEYPPTPLKGE